MQLRLEKKQIVSAEHCLSGRDPSCNIPVCEFNSRWKPCSDPPLPDVH